MMLADRLRSNLSRLDGVRVLDRGHRPCAIVTAEIAHRDPTDVVNELRRRHINASASPAWLGLIDMAEKKASAALRLSPHYYNTVEEVDAATEALAEIIRQH